MRRMWTRWLTATLATGAVATSVAIATPPTTGDWDGNSDWNAPRTERAPAPKPAPAPAKPAPAPVAKPAPAPMPAARDCMFFPTGNRGSSVIELCRNMPGEVVAGQEFCYEIIVTNLTDMTLKEVVVTDACGQNFKMTKATPEPTSGGVPMTWKIGDLEPRASRTIKVCGTATGTGTVTSCATVSYNSLLCATTTVVQPALKLVCSAPAEAMLCDGYPVKFTVTNTGSGAARNVRVKADMPAGLTTTDGRNSVELDAGVLGAGQSREFTIATKPSKTGSYAVKGSAGAEGGLNASSDGCSTVVKQAVLGVKQTGASRAFIGRNFNWDITITNTGDAPATGCTLTEALPANARFVSATQGGVATGSAVTWNVGTLAPGASKSFQVTLAATGEGMVKGAATLKCACAADASAPVETSTMGIPAILVETVDDPDPIEVGGQTTYTITVLNQGSSPDSNVRVVCTLPDGLDFVSAAGATAGTAAGKTVSFAPVATLAPKQRVVFTVKAKASKGSGDSRFKTSVTSDQFKNAIEEIESTNLYE